MKRYILAAGVATGTVILTYAIWCHVSINRMEQNMERIDFEFELLQQDVDVSLRLCERIIRAMEQRQRSLEDIVMTNDNLNLTLNTIRTYNAHAVARRPAKHKSIGGGP